MLPIRALLNTANDGLRLGRCLETLHPCDEIVIVDHGSTDDTLRVAQRYGARILTAGPGHEADAHRQMIRPWLCDGWILCVEPRESLTEALAASLFEWKAGHRAGSSRPAPRSVFVREETRDGWSDHPVAQTRLVPGDWRFWEGLLPRSDDSVPLEGPLLRFTFP